MPRKIYKLFISYDEAGAELRRHVAEQFQYSSDCIWQASFRGLTAEDLPPGDGVVWVYPVFMQSGVTVTETLPELLRALYAGNGQYPELVFKPVWGAERGGIGFGVAAALRKELEGEASLLVVAHGVTGREAAPEPAQFLRQLRFLLPEGTDMALAYFGAFPSVEKVLPELKGQKVIVLPFLIGKGKHMREDMPAPELAARHGKTLKILPPFGAFYLQAEREYWKAGMEEPAGNGFDRPAGSNTEDAGAW